VVAEGYIRERGYSSPPATWDELIDYAKKLSIDKNGDGTIDQWLYWADYTSQFVHNRFGNFLWANGGRYINPDTLTADIDKREAIEAIQFYVDMSLKYRIAATADKAAQDATGAFVNGQVLSLLEYPYLRGPSGRKEEKPSSKKAWE